MESIEIYKNRDICVEQDQDMYSRDTSYNWYVCADDEILDEGNECSKEDAIAKAKEAIDNL